MKIRKHIANLSKITFVCSLVILLGLLFTTPVFAIDSPDTLTINSVVAFNSLLEDDDQLYVVDYTIDYTSNPDENITEAFIARLMNGSTEIGSQAPYAYYDEGYDRGVVAIYLTASEAPVWAGAYTLRLEGNPMLSWSGTRPITSTSGISWTLGTDQTGSLASHILWLADTLEVQWSVDLIETTATGSRLTTYGEAYFSSSVPYLALMCSNIFSGTSTNPDIITRPTGTAGSDYLRTRVQNTTLDFDEESTLLGMSTTTFGIVVGFLIMIVGLAIFAREVPGSGIITLLTIPFLIGFTLAGMIPQEVTILISVFAAAATIYIFTLEKSPA